ncbi:MAG: hypothetical protein ABW047_05540 [Nitrospiraceae bacterium]
MMNKSNHTIITVLVAVFALVSLDGSPASAKKAAKKSYSSSAAAAAAEMGPIPAISPAPKASQLDTKPGPAWKTVGGTVKGIQGDVYMVEDYEGNPVKLHVGQGTKRLKGNKKVGDTIRAEVTRGGFANSIQ